MVVVPVFQPKGYAPGLPFLGSGMERYTVRGGGVTAIALAPGDRIEVIDPQGLQRCEVAVFDGDGKDDVGALGATATGPAAALTTILASDREDARAVVRRLEQRAIKLRDTQALHLFDNESAPGESATFTAEKNAVCLLAAPGQDMGPDQQTPPTDLVALVKRATIRPEGEVELPTPLADPRLEMRIDRATAQTYEVKAGEYIQVIDVQGRQCSDFLAFSAAKLEAGIEHGLDPTMTRTLLGATYPSPGLFSKFFDQGMQPLVEVVRDTVGRHDSFNLACTARYYEDMGYPGHVNCTDNFNATLDKYGVAPAKAGRRSTISTIPWLMPRMRSTSTSPGHGPAITF